MSWVDGRTQCVSGALVAGLGNSRDAPSRALDPQKLNEFYELAVIGKSRVAGRNAVIVSITPRDQYRYGFELHLDRETAFRSNPCCSMTKGNCWSVSSSRA